MMYTTFEELGKILRHIYHSTWDWYDYPNYGGLPESIHAYLSAEFNDVIQDFYDKRDELEQDDWLRAVSKRLQEVKAQEMEAKSLWGDFL